MNRIRKAIRAGAAGLGAAALLLLSAVTYFQYKIPDSFYVNEGQELVLQNLSAVQGGTVLDYEKTSLASRSSGAGQTIELKLFGIIPVKETHVSVVEQQNVTPGGTPFGIKLFTRGVIVIDVSGIETSGGMAYPAKLAGICKGDNILTVGGVEISSNEDIAAVIKKSAGKAVPVTLQRDGKTIKTVLSPALSSVDGEYKGGVWVRDSSAGIGTITYYNENTGSFAGLGHGICDVDTGEIMPLNSGEVCAVHINSIQKGQAGTPGELRGSFTTTQASGQLLLNNEAGIFGSISYKPNELSSVPVSLKQEVKTGPATIFCTLDDNGIQEYTINIDKIDLNPRTLTKNMMITVTDPELLSKTGGIVQGMSGSPILQNGKLVGAVTHVFVNNPTKGYGIFAENMLNYSNKLAEAG